MRIETRFEGLRGKEHKIKTRKNMEKRKDERFACFCFYSTWERLTCA